MASVIILGGGIGGVVAANVLSKTLDKEHRIVLVDRKDSHVYQSSYPLTIVNQRNPKNITRKLDILEKKGIEFIQAQVMSVNQEQCNVQTDKGIIDYDFLILSLGVEHHPETVPGFTEGAYNVYNFDDVSRLQNTLKEFNKGKIVLFISSIPFSCPPAPYEITFLLDAYFRERGIRDKVELSIIIPETSPEANSRPAVQKRFRDLLKERQIGLTTEAKILFLDASTNTLHLDQGITAEADLFLGIPSHWGPGVMENTGLVTEGNWIEVDPHTMQTKNEKIYAIGDATALRLPVMRVWAPKAGIFAHYQAEVVSRNIAAKIMGKKPHFRYTGKGA